MHTRAFTHTQTYTDTNVQTHTHTHTCAHTNAHTNAHAHTHTHARVVLVCADFGVRRLIVGAHAAGACCHPHAPHFIVFPFLTAAAAIAREA